jgi:hypothetical protein
MSGRLRHRLAEGLVTEPGRDLLVRAIWARSGAQSDFRRPGSGFDDTGDWPNSFPAPSGLPSPDTHSLSGAVRDQV